MTVRQTVFVNGRVSDFYHRRTILEPVEDLLTVKPFYMTKIIVTGAGGQLGREFSSLAADYPRWEFLLPDRRELDINDAVQVSDYFSVHRPDYCLNTAAYTAVDRAESEREAAFATNATAVQNLAKVCKVHGTHLFHYGTDYVYQPGIDRPRDGTLGTR